MICPSDCPSDGKKRVNGEIYCSICGELILPKTGYYCMNGFPYCTECLDFADAETLVRICEMSKRKWLEKMGFSYAVEVESEGRRQCVYGA
jgi:hypothetical protein